jgi:hypothetical protein
MILASGLMAEIICWKVASVLASMCLLMTFVSNSWPMKQPEQTMTLLRQRLQEPQLQARHQRQLLMVFVSLTSMILHVCKLIPLKRSKRRSSQVESSSYVVVSTTHEGGGEGVDVGLRLTHRNLFLAIRVRNRKTYGRGD